MPWPKLYERTDRPTHPYLAEYGASFAYDEHFDTEDRVRRAVAGYYGLCSFLDENVGKVLAGLQACGLDATTQVLYTSDHGDNLGARGVWGKSTMYEEAVGVPLLLAGPGLPRGQVCPTPVTHVDIYPTVLQATGIPATAAERDLPGRSLFDSIAAPDPERIALAEYHGMGSTTASFMLRVGRYKYIHYVDYPPQLFDMVNDPEELHDIAADPAAAAALAMCRARLFNICDPAEVDARAKRRQAEQLVAHGGRDAVIARGDLGYSPPPGVAAEFRWDRQRSARRAR